MVKVLVCCLLVLTSLTALRGQTLRTFQDFLQSCSAHLQAGELDAALTDVNKAIDLNPRNVDAYALRCLIRNKQDGSDCPDEYDKIIELAPSAPETAGYYVGRANYRAGKHKWDEALDDLAKAISIDPQSGGSYSLRSYVYMMKGDLADARTDYDKGLELQPRLASPFVRRGWLRYQTRDLDGALADFSNAIEWKPDYAEAHADRGIVRGLQGNMDEAIKEIKLAAGMNPQSISDRIPDYSFNSPFWELNQFSQAYPLNARAHELLGIFRLLDHKPMDATSEFNKALDLEPALKAEIDRIAETLRP